MTKKPVIVHHSGQDEDYEESPQSLDDKSDVPREPPFYTLTRSTTQVVKMLSLVGLKNLFFESRTIPTSSHSSRSAGNEAASLLSDDTELESQRSSSESSKCARKFRVDARIISDATIGLSDGLTVPFALTAGLSALGNTRVVIYGGFAELIAGAISMGLGGYLGAKSEAASYLSKYQETLDSVAQGPDAVRDSVQRIFDPYGLPSPLLEDITSHLNTSTYLPDFIMRFEHYSPPPASSRALVSASTIALAYFLGGLLPLIPYFFVDTNEVLKGLYISVAAMIVALWAFGYVKTCVIEGWDGFGSIKKGCSGGLQMVCVGGLAAGAAMALVKAFNQLGNGV